jgi:hypothetical protein
MPIAIKDEPRGFLPFGRIISTHHYVGGATAIYPGDLVVMNAGGKVTVAAAGGTQIMGVAASYKTATGTTVIVYDDPDQQFIVQDDATGTTVLTQAAVGLNFDILATTGSATLLKSKHELARGGASTTQTTASAQLRLLGIISATGANSLVRVQLNEHTFKKATGI